MATEEQQGWQRQGLHEQGPGGAGQAQGWQSGSGPALGWLDRAAVMGLGPGPGWDVSPRRCVGALWQCPQGEGDSPRLL